METQGIGWLFRVVVIAIGAAWIAVLAASYADADTERAPSAERDEYSFQWLDPDKKIYVLQNRRYLKADRFLLSATVGPALGNSYRSSFALDPRVAYFLSEAFGIELFHTFVTNSENNTFEALKQATGSGALPIVREVRSQYGALAHYVPWYAKINVFNTILYFDWYFSAGVGSLKTALDTRPNAQSAAQFVDEALFSLFLGTGHQYHLSHLLVVRLDFTGAFYQAPIFGTTGGKTWFSNYTFGVGLGVRL